MLEIFTETIIDMLKIIPILFLVYVFIEFFQAKMGKNKLALKKLNKFGPLVGGALGSVPQCGFSASFAALYNEKLIGRSMLISVFIATSDEAIPVILAYPEKWGTAVLLIASKLIMALSFGYLLLLADSKSDKVKEELTTEFSSCENEHHHDSKATLFKSALYHTVKISVYIFITSLIINYAVEFIGIERISDFLLQNSIFQPFLIALIGLIPGCATSVLITQLFLSGAIQFGSVLAGLATGAGFGYIVLFRGAKKKSDAVKIILIIYLCATLTGMLVQLLTVVF